MSPAPRLAIVTPGFTIGGGVPRVARFLRDVASSNGLEVNVIDLATSRHDSNSSRLLQPRTLMKSPAIDRSPEDNFVWRVGCHLAELEPCRYVSTSNVRRLLDGFDLVQVVAGTPSWAMAVRGVKVPVALQVATTTNWERKSRDTSGGILERSYRRAATASAGYFDRLGATVPDATFVENHEMLSWMRGAAQQGARVTLIPPGIDTELFSPSSEPWDPRRPLVSVGRLGEARKGWDRLIRAYMVLAQQVPDIPTLRIIGKGEPTPSVRKLLSDAQIACRVRIYRDPTDVELARLLASSSIFVATPYEEGLGLAALEAMACGLPVIATETAGSREYLIPGKTGFMLLQDGDSLGTQLVNGYLQTVRHGADMSQFARRFVTQHYANSHVGRKIMNLWHSVLASPPNPSSNDLSRRGLRCP